MAELKNYHLIFCHGDCYVHQDIIQSTNACQALEDWTKNNGFIYGVDNIKITCDGGLTIKLEVEM